MTTIAWDGKTLAADRMSTMGDMSCIRTKLKILKDGSCVATYGDTDKGFVLKLWYEDGCKPDGYPKFQETDDWCGLVVVERGKVHEYNQMNVPIPCEDPFMAWGSGKMFALGAMAHGATAEEAVLIANRLCLSSGNGVDSYTWS